MTDQRAINQRGATAGRDIVGGDQHIHHHHAVAPKGSVVEQLLARLQLEIENNKQVRAMIDNLRYYYEHKSHDGVDGLEAKLHKGEREHEIMLALEKKELFAKTLEKWSMYASAQEIFVHLLARAEYAYSAYVLPQVGTLTEVAINDEIAIRIVEPIVEDCGASMFRMNHATAMGMLYWLAEQCFVRWHK